MWASFIQSCDPKPMRVLQFLPELGVEPGTTGQQTLYTIH